MWIFELSNVIQFLSQALLWLCLVHRTPNTEGTDIIVAFYIQNFICHMITLVLCMAASLINLWLSEWLFTSFQAATCMNIGIVDTTCEVLSNLILSYHIFICLSEIHSATHILSIYLFAITNKTEKKIYCVVFRKYVLYL